MITRKHFSVLESVRTAPSFFQELIPKRIELRVTIILNGKDHSSS
jgi:hypothetical protein